MRRRASRPPLHRIYPYRLTYDYSYKLTPAQLDIYTNITTAQDAALELLKKRAQGSGAVVKDYAGHWEEDIDASGQNTKDNETPEGGFTSFTAENQSLGDAVLYWLKEEIEQEFPEHVKGYWSGFEDYLLTLDEKKAKADIEILQKLLSLRFPKFEDIAHKLRANSNYDIEGEVKYYAKLLLLKLSFRRPLEYVKINAYYSVVREAADETIPIWEEKEWQEETRQANLRRAEEC